MAEKSKRILSERRKQKYMKILERARCAAETIEEHSIVENCNTIEGLLIDADQLLDEGKIEDRIGCTTEFLMDVQVTNEFPLQFDGKLIPITLNRLSKRRAIYRSAQFNKSTMVTFRMSSMRRES